MRLYIFFYRTLFLTQQLKLWTFFIHLPYFEAINCGNIVHKLLGFCDAFISKYVIPQKNNVFLQDVLNSFLSVIKSCDGSFFKENIPVIPVWYITNIRVGMITLFLKSWYDFLDVDRNRLLPDIFQPKYDINVRIMQYNRIVNHIKKS